MEKDFRELKRLVVRAVDVFVPDFEGALAGTNPFLILPLQVLVRFHRLARR